MGKMPARGSQGEARAVCSSAHAVAQQGWQRMAVQPLQHGLHGAQHGSACACSTCRRHAGGRPPGQCRAGGGGGRREGEPFKQRSRHAAAAPPLWQWAGGHAQRGCPARRSVWGVPRCSPAGGAAGSHPAHRPPPAALPACQSNPLCRRGGPSEGWREGGEGGARAAGAQTKLGAGGREGRRPACARSLLGRGAAATARGLGVHLGQPPRSCTGSPPPAAPRRRLLPAGRPRRRGRGWAAGGAP